MCNSMCLYSKRERKKTSMKGRKRGKQKKRKTKGHHHREREDRKEVRGWNKGKEKRK